jgi:hypothetical protein
VLSPALDDSDPTVRVTLPVHRLLVRLPSHVDLTKRLAQDPRRNGYHSSQHLFRDMKSLPANPLCEVEYSKTMSISCMAATITEIDAGLEQSRWLGQVLRNRFPQAQLSHLQLSVPDNLSRCKGGCQSSSDLEQILERELSHEGLSLPPHLVSL